MFHELYGLSCVENQTLYYWREQGEAVEPLYALCGVSLGELYRRMVLEGESAAGYSGLRRIQDVLRVQGALSWDMRPAGETGGAAVARRLARCPEGEALLAEVTPAFTRERLYARGWRQDHYVRVLPGGKDASGARDGVWVLNDRPEKTLCLTEKELEQACTGRTIRLGRLRAARPLPAPRRADLYGTASPFPEEKRGLEERQDLGEWLTRMSGMLTIYGLLRRRLAAYQGREAEELRELERRRSTVEYARIKGHLPCPAGQWLKELSELDRRLLDTLLDAGQKEL